MKCHFRRIILVLILSLCFMLHPDGTDASRRPPVSNSNERDIRRIVSITTHRSNTETTVNVLADGKIVKYITKTLKTPPRIVIDIIRSGSRLKGLTVAVKNPDIKKIRVGYYPEKIRLVLDVEGKVLPPFSTRSVGNELFVSLKSKAKKEKKEHPHETEGLEQAQKKTTLNKTGDVTAENILKQTDLSDKKHRIPEKVAPVHPEIQDKEVNVPISRENYAVKKQKPSKGCALNKVASADKLTQELIDDGKEDTSLYLKCLDDYRTENWKEAVENLTHFINKYQNGRYLEKAYFLLAKSYDQLGSESISLHYKEIKDHYEDAVNRFPDSEFVTEAMFGIGTLYFKTKDYHEAFAYYTLVLKKDKRSILTIKALMQQAKILLLRKKREEALPVLTKLEDVTSGCPDMPERIEAQLLKAKTLYEMNHFRESINILDELEKRHPENIYRFPEISLYIGYNRYQLGDNTKARKHLYRFYNSCSDQRINHLVLTQIGDTYRNEGLIKDAVKIYRMVLDHYPNTDGAIISKIRLAEQQEEGNLKEDTCKEIGSPKEIYQNIVEHFADHKKKNPLLQLSMLKLAITYQKEKAYQKSFMLLKELLEKHPETSMREDARQALMKTIEGILKDKIMGEKYISIVNFYLKENKMFLTANSPDLYLSVARAFMQLNLEDMAEDVFKKADPLLSDKEKPSDLLFQMGKYFFKKKKFRNAQNRFNLLIDNYPSDKYISYAYQFNGNIHLKQERYEKASVSFSEALKYPVPVCRKADILINEAKAFMKSSFNDKALMAINDAESIKGDCNDSDNNISRELGDLYLQAGYTKKALDSFNQALKRVKSDEDKILLKLRVAQCYMLLDKEKDSLVLYNQVLSLNDPFWSKIATEKIKEIQFERENKATPINER